MPQPNQTPASHTTHKPNTPATTPNPNPPRWLWTKRCVLASVLLALGLVGLWLCANKTAKQRYQEQLAAIQAQGEPIQVEDLDQSPIPDQDNKVFYIRQAYEQHWPSIPGQSSTIIQTKWFNQDGKDHITGQPIPNPITDNATYLAQCQPLIETILASKQAQRVDWQHGYTKHHMLQFTTGELTETRNTAKLLKDSCFRHLEEQNPDQALQCIQAMFAVHESLLLDPHNPLINHLVAISIQALALETLEQALPHLTANQANQVRRMQAALLDESALRDSAHRSLGIERMLFVDTFDLVMTNPSQVSTYINGYQSNHNAATQAWAKLTQPIFHADAVWYLNTITGWRALLHSTDSLPAYQQAKANSPTLSDEAINQALEQEWLHPFSGIMLPALDAFVTAQYKLLSKRRQAATALAIKLYQWDHGQYPETLDALVPDYLAAIPTDPMAPKDHALGYLPNGCSLYRSKDYDPSKNRHQEPRTGSPDPATAMPIQGPPIVHTIGPSGIPRGCPIEVEPSGKVLSNQQINNVYGLDWFALEPWPTAEPSQAHLDDLKAMEESQETTNGFDVLPLEWGMGFESNQE